MKLLDIKNLYESFDTVAKTISWVTIDKSFKGKFTDAYDDEYELILQNNDLSETSLQIKHVIYNIQFVEKSVNMGDSVKMTNRGRASSILSIVEYETLKKFKEENIRPDILIFSISKLPIYNTEKQITSRTKAYSMMAKRLKSALNLSNIYPDIHDKQHINILITKKPLSVDDFENIRYIISHKMYKTY
jgi:hypothetical protein